MISVKILLKDTTLQKCCIGLSSAVCRRSFLRRILLSCIAVLWASATSVLSVFGVRFSLWLHAELPLNLARLLLWLPGWSPCVQSSNISPWLFFHAGISASCRMRFCIWFSASLAIWLQEIRFSFRIHRCLQVKLHLSCKFKSLRSSFSFVTLSSNVRSSQPT